MATFNVDPAEFGDVGAVNRQCSGLFFHVYLVGHFAELKQASGTLVRFMHAGEDFHAILLPASVLAGETQGWIRQVVIMGADATMTPRVFWHVTHPNQFFVDGGPEPLTIGEHFFICRDYKPKLHCRQADWVVFRVNPAWVSKPVTLRNGSVVRYTLSGPQGFFRFAVVHPSIPLPPLAPVPVDCVILGFPEYSLVGAYPGNTTMALRIPAELDRLMRNDPQSLLVSRRLRVFTVTLGSSWEDVVAMLNSPLAAVLGSRTLPLKERQFGAEQKSLLKWPFRMARGLLKAAKTFTLDPLRGAGCKPALQDRQVVEVGEDLFVAEGKGPGQQHKPGKGWEGGPWLQAQQMPRVMNMHIGAHFQRPNLYLYFGRCMDGSWLGEAVGLLAAANPNPLIGHHQ